MKLQSAVKKESVFIAAACAFCTAVMLLVFFILNKYLPAWVPFGFREVLSGVLGWAVAAGNFFFMAVTVQKVAGMESEDEARALLMKSYRRRTIAQLGFVVLSFVLPFLNPFAAAIPLFFPSLVIKARSVIGHFCKPRTEGPSA